MLSSSSRLLPLRSVLLLLYCIRRAITDRQNAMNHSRYESQEKQDQVDDPRRATEADMNADCHWWKDEAEDDK